MRRSNQDTNALLDLYSRVRRKESVPDEKEDTFVNVLRLSGIVRAKNGELALRNRSYEQAFDLTWIRIAFSRQAVEGGRLRKNAVQTVRSLLGDKAFKRYKRGVDGHPNGYWEPKQFNASLYDILMWGFARYDRTQVFPHLDAIREALIVLMTEDQDFIDSIELSTSSVRAVTTRFQKWLNVLQDIIGHPATEPRCFTRVLKDELFQADPTGALCGQRIQDDDDAAVDHIAQYWTGGRTIPLNARLTHRYCNWSRPRHD